MASKKMTDEERYGKVGAEIRRLDPEAYKNRPKTMEGNLKLLEELRNRSKTTPARTLSPEEFMSSASRRREESSSARDLRPARNPRYVSDTAKEKATARRATAAMERNRGTLPSDRASGFRSQAQETGMTAEERAKKARDYSTNIAMTAGIGRLGATAGAPYRRTLGEFRRAADKASESAGRSLVRRNNPSFSERYRAGEAAAAAREKSPKRLRERAEQMLDEKLAADMAGGYRKGGRVKKYVGGGSVSSRADGIAKRGKTRGRII